MKKLGVTGIILFSSFILFLAGCNASESFNSDVKPDKIHHDFLLYIEDYESDDGESIGDLYIQSANSEREKIASNVKQHNYVYLNNKNKVLFLDKDDTLYEFKVGEEKVKLAEDVYDFNGNYNEDFVTYQNSNYDLYVIKDGKEEKIASDVYQVDIIDMDVYYSDYDGNFSVYNIDSRKELDIGNDVEYFQLLNQNGDLVYLNDESMLYYKKAGEESIRVSGEEVETYSLQHVDNQLIYSNYDGDLFVSDISSDLKTEKIASEIYYATYEDGKFYYLNQDGNLYEKGKKEETATKLVSDIASFRLVDGSLFFLDEEDTLYNLTSKGEKEKITSDVYYYDVYNGDVVYLNADEELFVNKTKVASGIREYAYYYGNLAYATEDEKLYLMEDLKESKVVIEDLSQYSTASYQNQIVFNNTLDFEDIAGFWKMESDYGVAYIDIKDDGTVEDYLENNSENYTIDYASYKSLDAFSDSDYVTFTKVDNETLTVDDGYDEYTLSKSSEEEAEQYIKDVRYQEDVEEVKYTVSEYLYEFTQAIYYGSTSSLGYYIDENGNLYQEQIDFITNLYDNYIEEEILDYEFEEVTALDKDTYEAIVNESYAIYYYDEFWSDPTEEFVEQTTTYTLKRMDGSFYIVDLEVKTVE